MAQIWRGCPLDGHRMDGGWPAFGPVPLQAKTLRHTDADACIHRVPYTFTSSYAWSPIPPHQRPRQTWYDLLVVTILIMRVHLSSFFAWTFSIKRVINQNTHSSYTRGASAIKKQAQHAQGEDAWVGWGGGGEGTLAKLKTR
jgi:hypothetical protein